MMEIAAAQSRLTVQQRPEVWRKSVVAVLGAPLLLAVLVVAFALPAARSAPHDVPIGVVGTPAQPGEANLTAAGFEVHHFATADDARLAILHREIYGALVLGSPTEVGVLMATAASSTATGLIQAAGQKFAQMTGRTVAVDDLRSFPSSDPRGTGLAAGAFPLAVGGLMGGLIVMLLVPSVWGRLIAAAAFSVVGGLAIVATLQFVIGTFDGNFWMTSLAGMLGIAATCFTVLGLGQMLGNPGIGLAAVLLVLVGNPLSGLATGPEMLPPPSGTVGQFLPPGATGTLMRNVAFFDGHGTTTPTVILTCYLITGMILYSIAVRWRPGVRSPGTS
jgi:prepilin-type processing-associated H-X9-DG protein